MTEAFDVGNVAHLRHELRTPINHILGYSEILIEDAAQRSLQSFVPAFEQIRDDGRQLLACIQTALGDEGGPVCATGLATLLSDLHSRAAEVLHHSETLRARVERSHQQTLADVEAISRALRNLLDYTQQDHSFAPAAPATAALSAEPALPKTQYSPSRREGTIVIADDDDANRHMLLRRLESEGHQGVEAKNGVEVLSILKAQRCDLVLLDILMPELDGFQTLAEMKQDPQLRDIPVIMISALDELSSVVRCIEMGAEDYLPKPFNRVLLRARIGASLEKKRLRDREHRKTEELQQTLLLLERTQEQLALQASHDALTGLANRRFVDAQIELREKQNNPFSVIYIDLNGFKAINDTYGHQAGDELLKQVGDRLRLAFRSTDIVGRWGGDEFVGLVDTRFGTTEAGMARIAECFRDTFVIHTGKTELRVNVGAAIGSATWRPGDNIAEVLKRADAAMYSSKQENSA